MAFADKVKNFAYGELIEDVSSSATSFSLKEGQGTRFPATRLPDTSGGAYYLTVYNPFHGSSAIAYQAGEAEIIRAVELSGDIYTSVSRAQQGTSSIAWKRGWKVELNIQVTAFGGGGGVASAVYFDTVAPSTLHNNGDVSFNTSTSPYTKYVQNEDAWVRVSSTPPESPVIDNYTLYGELLYGEDITWTGSGDTFTIQISDDSGFSNILVEDSSIVANSYDMTQFFKDNTILGIGGSYGLATTISGDTLTETGTHLHDISWLRNSSIFVFDFNPSNSYAANVGVSLSLTYYYVRVKAVVGGVDSDWSNTFTFQPMFGQGQMTILGSADDGTTSTPYSNNYGQSFHIFSVGSSDPAIRLWGYYNTTRDSGLFPTHTPASFKTFTINIPLIP